MDILRSTLLLTLIAAVAHSQYDSKDKGRNALKDNIRAKLEEQVSMEMKASLVYMVMASHFGSEEINRPGFNKLFKKASGEEREHAQKLIDYLGKRGTKLEKLDIKMPTKYVWPHGIEAFDDAINLENDVTDSLMKIHQLATEENDAHLTDFLEGEFLGEQIESIRELSGLRNNLNAMSHNSNDKHHSTHDKFAEYLFDLELQKAE